MKLSPQIHFVGQGLDPSLRESTKLYAEALGRYDSLRDCRISVGFWTKHQDHGRIFRVLIEAALPHTEVHVAREAEADASHAELDELLRGAIELTCLKIESAIESYDAPPQSAPMLSVEQRRLKPLHGIAN